MTKIANVLLTVTSSPLRFPVYLAIEITLSVFLERLKNPNWHGTNLFLLVNNLLVLKLSYNLGDNAALAFSAVTLPFAPALLHKLSNIIF